MDGRCDPPRFSLESMQFTFFQDGYLKVVMNRLTSSPNKLREQPLHTLLSPYRLASQAIGATEKSKRISRAACAATLERHERH